MLVDANLKHIKDWPVEWQSGSHDEIRRSCIEDFEGGCGGDLPAEQPWQQCNAVNNEWFDDSLSPHHATKRLEDIIRMLVDTVARNGNLLLNIALKADGTVVKEDSAVLDALTEFMSVNSEAIHGYTTRVVRHP
jgi:alpha-L-fucosidase